MASDLGTASEPSMTRLVAGILADTEELLRQQFVLLRVEVAEDLQHARLAGALLAAGAGIGLVGVTLLCFMLAHLLSALIPQVELWASFAVIGALASVTGVVLGLAGFQKLRALAASHESTKAFKENAQWVANLK